MRRRRRRRVCVHMLITCSRWTPTRISDIGVVETTFTSVCAWNICTCTCVRFAVALVCVLRVLYVWACGDNAGRHERGARACSDWTLYVHTPTTHMHSGWLWWWWLMLEHRTALTQISCLSRAVHELTREMSDVNDDDCGAHYLQSGGAIYFRCCMSDAFHDDCHKICQHSQKSYQLSDFCLDFSHSPLDQNQHHNSHENMIYASCLNNEPKQWMICTWMCSLNVRTMSVGIVDRLQTLVSLIFHDNIIHHLRFKVAAQPNGRALNCTVFRLLIDRLKCCSDRMRMYWNILRDPGRERERIYSERNVGWLEPDRLFFINIDVLIKHARNHSTMNQSFVSSSVNSGVNCTVCLPNPEAELWWQIHTRQIFP